VLASVVFQDGKNASQAIILGVSCSANTKLNMRQQQHELDGDDGIGLIFLGW